jgi:hypothetical protein
VDEASRLELPFEEREVYEVVKGMNRDKALGPDGFFMAFFQDCSEVIKDDIMGVFLTSMPVKSSKKVLMPPLYPLSLRSLRLRISRTNALLVLCVGSTRLLLKFLPIG